tara:strand:+ start:1106 stop:1333 length:228 start_codon:yes stop_codon:yes gene_type:complete
MPMRGKRVSPLRKEVYKLDFRVEQLEIALQHLMYVVANQDEELDDFKKCMKRADTDSTKLNTILSDIMQTEGGEA